MDRLLMAAIAAGLLWNAAMLTVNHARADDESDGQTLGEILWTLQKIENGTCVNHKLCGR